MQHIYENQRRARSIHEPARRRSSAEEPVATTLESVDEPAEVFVLPPLSRRRIKARVQRKGPARFRFVADDD